MTAPATAPPRLLTRDNLPLTVGAIALVTLGAFENRAVTTALPTAMTDLGGVTAYGMVVAAPLATYLIALTTSGWAADRHGPARVLRVGAVLFVLGQLCTALAPGVPVFVAGRLLGGLAEGFLDVGLLVLIAHVLNPTLRPRVMAMFASAWMLPSVLGPIVAGTITDAIGWRWVFGLGPILLVAIWPILRPAVRRSAAQQRPPGNNTDDALVRLLPWALAAAGALVVLHLVTESFEPRRGAAPLAVAALIAATGALVLAAARLLPPGSLRAECGIGGVVAVRAALGAAFAGVGAFLPLLLTTQRDSSATGAGVSLMITGAFWSVGSAVQSRLSDHPVGLVRAGLTSVAVGSAGTLLLLRPELPIGLGLLAWAVAATGMGMASSTLAVLTMSASDEVTQGRNNSGAQVASSMAIAVFLAAAGGVLALGGTSTAAFTTITVLGASLAGAGLLVSGRVRCAAPTP